MSYYFGVLLINLLFFVHAVTQNTNELEGRFPRCGNKKELWIYAQPVKFCYKILTRIAYDEAVEQCRALDSELISIHSGEENNFVLDLLKSNEPSYSYSDSLLLGAKRIDGWLKWSDGSDLDFSTWTDEEPPESIADVFPGKCISMLVNPVIKDGKTDKQLGRWKDSYCGPDKFKWALCKKKPLD